MPDTATATRPDACVMRGVIPYLSLGGRAAEAADFYARAFGAADLGRMPDPDKPGEHMHVQVEINGGALMMTDHPSEGGPGGSARAAPLCCPTSGSPRATSGACSSTRSASAGRSSSRDRSRPAGQVRELLEKRAVLAGVEGAAGLSICV